MRQIRTVGELKDALEYLDDDMPIRIAEQPNYPFEYTVRSVTEYEGKLFITEGRQEGYLDREVFA